MSGTFRPSAAFPFALSAVSFALVLLLVLSGTRPDLVPDGYLLSFNTTAVGQNLVQFNPATATPSAIAARQVNLLPNLGNSTSSTSQSNSTSSQSANSTSSSPATQSAPTLSIPAVAASAPPTGLNINVLGALFQVVLNGLASGVGDTLKGIVTLGVTTSKQQFGVTPIYTMHLLNVCQGTAANSTNSSSPFNIASCVSYTNVSSDIANLTSNVSNTTTVAATNITLPFLNNVPGLGKSAASAISTASALILFFFIVNLIGSGLSMILSVAAFFSSTHPVIYGAGAAITTISTTILQTATFSSTFLAAGISSSVNKFSSTVGLRATVGSKFLIFIWIGYIAAQMANGYWVTVWFVEYRKRSYKARERTAQQMGDYKGINKEILSDFRLQKSDDEEIQQLTMTGPNGLKSRSRNYYNEI